MNPSLEVSAESSKLLQVPIASINRNPENPRLKFRQGELEQLTESIRLHGIQVPISVYREGNKYVLIDGERRWRCARKLNKQTMPALVQDKPDPLVNLLLMFNIHSLREQWDLLTIALKLPRVIDLLAVQLERRPNERELAAQTGLPRGLIRRCKILIDLPERYKDQLLEELEKPKTKQRITEDFFIEMERALTTVERALPAAIPNRDRVRRVLIDKYRRNVITNVVQLRQIAKIARAEHVKADSERAEQALARLFSANGYTIADAFEYSVSAAYSGRDLRSRLGALLERLHAVSDEALDSEIRRQLRELIRLATELLKRAG